MENCLPVSAAFRLRQGSKHRKVWAHLWVEISYLGDSYRLPGREEKDKGATDICKAFILSKLH